MNERQKLMLVALITGIITCLIIGSTFAYWTWTSTSAQQTAVTFTVASGFTCKADGGGNITSSQVTLAPAHCTNSTYAIKRPIKVSTTQEAGKTIYLNMNLKVNSIGANLAATKNFRYAITTASTDCEKQVLAEGNFYGASTNTELPLLTNERYTQTTANDTLYLWIWLDYKETNNNTMNQPFDLTLTGSCTDQEPAAMFSPWGETADPYTRINFSSNSSASNGQGLYVFKPSINDTNPIYYYRGAVDNNNVLFGDYCWKIVRTTETGGIKLVYNGDDTNGECNITTGTDTQIGTGKFNTNWNSPADVGYMVGTRYTYSIKSSNQLATSYKYGNRFSWDGTNYTLIDTIDTTGTWATDYNTLNNNHYTCFNTTGTCPSLYYVYYTNSSDAYYITLTNGKSVEQAIDEMLTSSTNSNNSTIKGVIDSWYNTNLSSYTSFLEDTIWCNDRGIYQLNGWDPNGGNTRQYLQFNPYKRRSVNNFPSLKCASKNDSFTVAETTTGNGALTYPVGLLTVDEIMLAGGTGIGNSTYYLYTNQAYWAGSPTYFSNVNANEWFVDSTGYLNDYSSVYNTRGVRSAVSLKPGATWSGEGTASNPYTVSYS